MTRQKFAARTILLAALLGTLAACNTTAGIGRDIESVGSTIEDAAN